jgi:NAD(P)-dependent dehydrogenase (short-subunit alcohol dehydrogenase family)
MTVTLITGTSTGIGLATALHLAARGHLVYASMRDLSRGNILREAAASNRLPIKLLELNVDSEVSVQLAVGKVLAEEGQIDVLVNNAGIAPFGAIELTSDDKVKSVLETNFFGALRAIRAVLPSMRERRSGTIVNVSSVAGRVALNCMGIYAASKFALEAASEALAQELYPHGIRVVIIEPGIIVTPILGKALSELSLDPALPYVAAERRINAIITQGQETGGHPQVVADAIESALTTKTPKLRFLAGSDAGVFVTGRSRMSDEEWVAMGRHETDEDYFQEFGARFPMPSS